MPASRTDVPVADGGAIAVWVDGEGPPLVLVHGSMCSHDAFDALVAELRGEWTTYAMDRRGFGASPDPPEYSADQEFDDVAAVADAVAERDGPVVLLGHSWGASCAMVAATRTAALGALVLYEPSLGLRYPAGAIDKVEALVAAGDHEAAVLCVLTDVAGMSAEAAEAVQAAPTWPSRVATAPTITREARIEEGWDWRPEPFGRIDVPTLFLTGSESTPELAEITRRSAAAIPGARIHVLAGHDHFAYRFAPAVVAEALRDFLA